MDLIERYVGAVTERLRGTRRAEVEAELRSAILDSLEGRGATRADEEQVIAVLTEFGEPARVAAAYQPGGQYLIGPDLYPLFRRAASIALAILVLGSAAAFGVRVLLAGLGDFGAGAILIETIGVGLRAALLAVLVLVAAFTWLQRKDVRAPRAGVSWDPRDLPPTGSAHRAPRFASVVAVVSAAVCLVIVGGIGDGVTHAIPRAPAGLRPFLMDGVLLSVMLLQVTLVLYALLYAYVLVRNRWGVFTRILRHVVDAMSVAVWLWLAVRLMDAAPELSAAGAPRSFVTWLVINAFVVAAVVLGLAVAAALRHRKQSGGGMGMKERTATSLVGSALLAATALLVAALPN